MRMKPHSPRCAASLHPVRRNVEMGIHGVAGLRLEVTDGMERSVQAESSLPGAAVGSLPCSRKRVNRRGRQRWSGG
jgi:hypothetical protein